MSEDFGDLIPPHAPACSAFEEDSAQCHIYSTERLQAALSHSHFSLDSSHAHMHATSDRSAKQRRLDPNGLPLPKRAPGRLLTSEQLLD